MIFRRPARAAEKPSGLHDFRCMITGIGLLGAECAVILLAERDLAERDSAERDASFVPISLPLWGQYFGKGTVEEIAEGPNADAILRGMQQLQRDERLTIDWTALGIDRQSFDHVEDVIGLLSLAHIHGPEAMKCDGRRLTFALSSSYVTASLMEEESDTIATTVPVERLPEVVFDEDPIAQTLYADFARLPIRLRCRFGLALAGLSSLSAGLRARDVAWAPPPPPLPVDATASEKWFARALTRAQSDPIVMAGLADHASERA